MATTSRLAGLPAEILEAVVVLLDVADICKLRLTCVEVAAKASQGSFKAGFTTKELRISPDRLQQFVAVTQTGRLGCLLKDLTIIGAVSAPDKEEDEQQKQINTGLLAQALTQLRANSDGSQLQKLSLTVEDTIYVKNLWVVANVWSEPDWSSITKCAGATAATVIQAVQTSAIPIENLDLFGTTIRCALDPVSLQTISGMLQTSQLKSLTIAVTGYRELSSDTSRPSVAELLKECFSQAQKLEHVDIRWMSVKPHDQWDEQLNEPRLLSALAGSFVQTLNSLSLRGLRTTATDLEALIRQYPHIQGLHLEAIRLKDGKFDKVFATVSELPELTSLYLEDLWETHLLQFVGATGEQRFPHSGPPTWISREGVEARRKIVYKLMTATIKGSAKANNWQRKGARLYGPV